MVALSLNLNPIITRPADAQQYSLDASMSVAQDLVSSLKLDLSCLVMPKLGLDFAKTITSQVDASPLSEMTLSETTPLRAIANEFLSTQVVASVVPDRIAEALEIIVGMERGNAARDTELSWYEMYGHEMYGLAAVRNSPAVIPAKQPVSEYASQLEASLAA